MERRRWFLALVLAPFLAGSAAADGYRTGRVSDVRGSLAVRGDAEDDVSYVERNAVVREGDVLWTDDRGLAELELERSAWVRMAENTKLEIRSLPPSGEFRLWTGSLYFDLSEHVEQPIRLRTPAGDVDVFPSSVVRVDLGRDESARVSVYSGRAQAHRDRDASVRVTSGERVYLEPGRGPSAPAGFDRGDLDGFDRYHRERVDYFLERPMPRELREHVLGGRDLEGYGSWVTVDSVRYWRPRCGPDWRPYSSGYWSYVPGCGYTWIDYAPWGYATCHYGGWIYRPAYGWLWHPGYRWAPAYVHWSVFDGYYGWAPLDPYGYPCYYSGGSNFCLTIGTRNFFIDFRSWTFCPADRFFYGRHHRRFDGHGHRGFYAGHEVKLRPDRFRLVGDVHREIGVPRERVRGLTVGAGGASARERVLALEGRIPERRQRLIGERFGVPADRDRVLARRSSEAEALQRRPGLAIDERHLVRGPEAGRGLPELRPGGDRGPADRARGGDAVRPPTAGPVRGEDRVTPPAASPVRPDRGRGETPGDRDRDGRFRRGEPRGGVMPPAAGPVPGSGSGLIPPAAGPVRGVPDGVPGSLPGRDRGDARDRDRDFRRGGGDGPTPPAAGPVRPGRPGSEAPGDGDPGRSVDPRRGVTPAPPERGGSLYRDFPRPAPAPGGDSGRDDRFRRDGGSDRRGGSGSPSSPPSTGGRSPGSGRYERPGPVERGPSGSLRRDYGSSSGFGSSPYSRGGGRDYGSPSGSPSGGSDRGSPPGSSSGSSGRGYGPPPGSSSGSLRRDYGSPSGSGGSSRGYGSPSGSPSGSLRRDYGSPSGTSSGGSSRGNGSPSGTSSGGSSGSSGSSSRGGGRSGGSDGGGARGSGSRR